jgi:hypothetical protein
MMPSLAQHSPPARTASSTEPVSDPNAGTLVLVSATPCDVYVDGQKKGCVTNEKPLEVKLLPGDHLLEAMAENGGRWKRNLVIGPTARSVVEIEDVERFVPGEDRTLLDTRTGLMWAPGDNGSDITWHDAKAYCEDFRGGGYEDWRMPTLEELEGLYQAKTHRPFIHRTGWIWSSETEGTTAAYFGFIYGKRYWHFPSYAHSLRALPVRKAKPQTRETGNSAE